MLDVSALRAVPEGTVVLNTEQLTGVGENWREQLTGWFQSGLEVWDYSPANIEVIKALGVENVRYLPIGYQKELQRIDITVEQDIDVLFYGSLNERRREIFNQIEAKGLNLKVLMGVYGKDRDQWIVWKAFKKDNGNKVSKVPIDPISGRNINAHGSQITSYQ